MSRSTTPQRISPALLTALTALVTAALWGCSAAWAQERGRPAQPTLPSWSVGVFASTETSPYRGADNDNRLLPVLAFENRYVRLAGPMIDFKLPSAGAMTYSLRARYSLEGYEASDSASLAVMAERKGGIWLGAKADWRLPLATLSTEWMGDANGRSGGHQIGLIAEKTLRMGGVILAPRAALRWQDSNYVDYYFGVRNNETSPGRAAYAGKSGVNTELGLRAIYAFSSQQSVFMDVQTTALSSAVTKSPLVDRNWVSALRLGYAYRF
ncbi:MAG: MipA/OmpV family protein [Hydrogenophaga sp.]